MNIPVEMPLATSIIFLLSPDFIGDIPCSIEGLEFRLFSLDETVKSQQNVRILISVCLQRHFIQGQLKISVHLIIGISSCGSLEIGDDYSGGIISFD